MSTPDFTSWSHATITRIWMYVVQTAEDSGHFAHEVRLVSAHSGESVLLDDLASMPADEYGNLNIVAPHLTVQMMPRHVRVVLASAPREMAEPLLHIVSLNASRGARLPRAHGPWILSAVTAAAIILLLVSLPSLEWSAVASLGLVIAALSASIAMLDVREIAVMRAARHQRARLLLLTTAISGGLATTALAAAVSLLAP